MRARRDARPLELSLGRLILRTVSSVALAMPISDALSPDGRPRRGQATEMRRSKRRAEKRSAFRLFLDAGKLHLCRSHLLVMHIEALRGAVRRVRDRPDDS